MRLFSKYLLFILPLIVFINYMHAFPLLAIEGAYETDLDNSYNSLNLTLSDEFDSKLTGGIGYIAQIGDDELHSLISLKAGYKHNLHKRFAVHPFMDARYNINESAFLIQPAFELRFYVMPSICLDFRAGYNTYSDKAIFGFGIGYKIGFRDSDRDWVRNDIDRCGNTPLHAKVDRDGCGIDRDGDGVFDGIDRCPDTPFSAYVDSLGCPADSDGDSVYDGVDRCPDTPNGINVDSLGCPADSDQDGVSDFEDICKETPLGAEVDVNGCPKDTDEDGIVDGIDRCPGTPTGFEVDRFGCPYIMPIDSVVIYDLYDASLNLHGKAVGILDKIAQRIRAYPDRKITLRVYTDSEGSPRFNYNRSSTVVNKVRDFLVERGVDEANLTLEPKGEQSPVATNSTTEGIRKNRRLEIIGVID